MLQTPATSVTEFKSVRTTTHIWRTGQAVLDAMVLMLLAFKAVVLEVGHMVLDGDRF